MDEEVRIELDRMRREIERLRLENERLASSATRARVIDDEEGARFFEMSLDLLSIAGVDGFLKRVNPSWTRVLGWTEEEMTSRPSIELVHPDDREATLAARAQLVGGTPLIALTNRYLCKDGSHRWIDWRCVPVLERGLIYAAARDVTAKHEADLAHAQLQRQLMFSDRMMSLGTLAAGMAHEINNPLTYVMANLELTREELRGLVDAPSTARVSGIEEMLDDACLGAERVRKIVLGLKTFSRADEERRATMDVKPALEMAVRMVHGEIRHRAMLVTDYRETPLVEADEGRLGQVFVNLLVNAAQSIPEGAMEASSIRVMASTAADGGAVVEVSDTGIGIPDALQVRIFEPFFTTKEVGVGTGLGLSICHNIVTGLGGRISVTSAVGHGSTFRVWLPASRASQIERTTALAVVSASARATVLVIDDEPGVGAALRRVLREHDVTVRTSAREALALVAGGQRFDVILSDMMMPQMTGMDLHAELARLSPRDAAGMVFITGGAFTQAATAFLARVPNERIAKPFTAEAVRALVRARACAARDPSVPTPDAGTGGRRRVAGGE
jgi:PAS domain S-box-containing protein